MRSPIKKHENRKEGLDKIIVIERERRVFLR